MMILLAGNVVLLDKTLGIVNITSAQRERTRYFPIKMKKPRLGSILGMFKFIGSKFAMLEEIESYNIDTDNFIFIKIDEYEIRSKNKIVVDNCPIPIRYNGNLTGPIIGDLEDIIMITDNKTTYYPHLVKLI